MSTDGSGQTQYPESGPPERRGASEPLHVPQNIWTEAAVDAPRPTAGPADDGMRIGLWGSPAAGKTTFIGALRLAALGSGSAYGRWQVIASDRASEKFMIETSHQLSIQRRFPEATQDSLRFSWRFLGDLAGSSYAPRKRWRGGRGDRAKPGTVQFLLSLLDVPGAFFDDLEEHPETGATIDHLSESAGLIYLFDPTREAANSTSFAFLNGTLARMSRKCLEEGRMDGPYLPHHISVCLTKFDDPEVFERARRGNWTDAGPDGVPTVHDAEGFFDWLAQDLHGSTMQLVGQALRASFHPERIRFFVTSAIGFASAPGGVVNLRQFGNVNQVEGEPQIIGPVVPHNVMEPVISLLLGIQKRG